MTVRGVALGPYSSALLGILLKITSNEKDTLTAGHGVTAAELSSGATVSAAAGVAVANGIKLEGILPLTPLVGAVGPPEKPGTLA